MYEALQTHGNFLFEELIHFSNHFPNEIHCSFALMQKNEKIKAVNCLTAGFSSTRDDLC